MQALSLATWLLALCAAAAMVLAVWRIARGPTRTDRIIALDILLAAALALCLAAAVHTGRTVYVDVAIGLALVGFVGTVGWSRLIHRSALGQQPAAKEPRP